MGTKKIKFWELVLMNVSALYGIRWIAKSTSDSFGLGLGAIPMWIIFMIIFFVPQALMCAELASAYPTDGGLNDWVKIAFGTKYGFMVSWMHWTALIFWYASFLTFFSINFTYMIGKPELADNKILVLLMSLAVFWALSFASMRGMKFGKYFTSVGSLGSVIPTICLIGMAILAIVILKKAPSASTYTIATMTPKLNMNSLVAISGITFAYTGAEFTANFASEMENPQKNYPRAIIIAAGTICVLYVLGSICMTMLMPTSEIFAYTGTLDALIVACDLLGIPHVFVQVVAFGITLSIFGAIVLYIAQPTKMLFGYAEPGIFPEKITKKNKHDIPERAILLQAVLVTILLAGVALFPAVETIYNVLITMTALTSLFPYVLLFAAYIKIKKQKEDKPELYQMTRNKKWGCFLGYSELVICAVAIVCSALPVMGNVRDNIIYEVEMIGGGLLVIFSGLWLWKRSGLKNKTFDIKTIK
ncbi:MAG: APC family permease [Oliverpabstia sp.]